MVTEIIYARRDMRSKHGILYTYCFGKLIPKWTITKMIYDKLSEKNKKKWIKIEE